MRCYIRAFCENCTDFIKNYRRKCHARKCLNFIYPQHDKTRDGGIIIKNRNQVCLAHKIQIIKCEVCKNGIEVNKSKVYQFINENSCNCCGTIYCQDYDCWYWIDHDAKNYPIDFDDIMPNINYKYYHIKKKENFGKRSRRVSRVKNKYKNKSYWKRRKDIESNVLSTKKWNKRYQLSLNGY